VLKPFRNPAWKGEKVHKEGSVYTKERMVDSKIRRKQGVREIGREVEGVKVSDFLGIGVICDKFHWAGVTVKEAQIAKKECIEGRKCWDGHRAWSIRMCMVSSPKDLLVGYR
jgi:hypothetical protein